MSVRFAMQNDLPRRHHVRRYGLHDHLVHTAEARRLQAEAIAKGARWVWTNTRRALQRLTNGKSREQTPAANGKQVFKTLGRASVADAFRRDRQRLARLVHRLILEPYARSRRRRIAIAQLRALDDRLLADIGLTRGQIERAVDGKLAPRGEILRRPCAPLARKGATAAAPRSRSVVAAKTERGAVASAAGESWKTA